MDSGYNVYEDINKRTGGEIYLGVVGPVRTGKSTFIKNFMEIMVIPELMDEGEKQRTIDELPQSSDGKTIMTTEPKFIPKNGAALTLPSGAACKIRLIDCVGYIVPSSLGYIENDQPRMVVTPWFEKEIPFNLAAEIGTQRVINEHSTIGLVVTTDGSITDIPREDYLEAEERVITELQALGKPFVVLLNSTEPHSGRVMSISRDIESRFGVQCLPVNCLELTEESITYIIKSILYEFPLREMRIFLPAWVDALPVDHPIKQAVYGVVREGGSRMAHIREVEPVVKEMGEQEDISLSRVLSIDLGRGIASAELQLPRELFYQTLSSQSGFTVSDDGDLMELLTELAGVKARFDKVSDALTNVYETGYGIVMPTMEELLLEEPEVMRQGGRYGIKLKASAPSIHMFKVDIESTVSPIVGNEKQSEDMINYLLQEYEGDSSRIWEANIFGKSLHELVNEDLNSKINRMPEDARTKLRETLQRIINEGSGGLICIIL